MTEELRSPQTGERPSPLLDLMFGAVAGGALLGLVQAGLVAGGTAFVTAGVLGAAAGPITRRAPGCAAIGFFLPGFAAIYGDPYWPVAVWLWCLLSVLFGLSVWVARRLAERFWPPADQGDGG